MWAFAHSSFWLVYGDSETLLNPIPPVPLQLIVTLLSPKYLLGIYYVPGTVAEAGDTVIIKAR